VTQHVGIVGVSAEGAALCYRTLCVEGATLFGRHGHPEVSLHTISLAEHMRPIEAGDWEASGELVLCSADKLRKAGADFLICPDNTAHQAIDLVRSRSPLPWLHIAEEVAAAAAERGFRRLLLLGTRYLMEGPVYPPKLAAKGIAFETPPPEDRERINTIIFDELVNGRFEEPARAYFRGVIDRGRARGCDAAALCCTEIPILIGEADSSLPILDSTRLLARAALREAARGR
jgi:aspartate racemase